jgi:hypothetical protein
MPPHQLHSTATGDNIRRKLRVYFDNSSCHAVSEVLDEMTRLRCKTVPHSPYSTRLDICDFYLFDRIGERLAGVTEIGGNDLRSKVISILAKISEEEKVRVFDHWIERCEWVTEHD